MQMIFTCNAFILFSSYYIHVVNNITVYNCERFEPRSHFKCRLSLLVQVNIVLNRTVVVDSD